MIGRIILKNQAEPKSHFYHFLSLFSVKLGRSDLDSGGFHVVNKASKISGILLAMSAPFSAMAQQAPQAQQPSAPPQAPVTITTDANLGSPREHNPITMRIVLDSASANLAQDEASKITKQGGPVWFQTLSRSGDSTTGGDTNLRNIFEQVGQEIALKKLPVSVTLRDSTDKPHVLIECGSPQATGDQAAGQRLYTSSCKAFALKPGGM